MELNLFAKTTGLSIEVDQDYFDEEYGSNRFRIIDDISLIEVVSRLNVFNEKYSRKIVPSIIGNEIFIYL